MLMFIRAWIQTPCPLRRCSKGADQTPTCSGRTCFLTANRVFRRYAAPRQPTFSRPILVDAQVSFSFVCHTSPPPYPRSWEAPSAMLAWRPSPEQRTDQRHHSAKRHFKGSRAPCRRPYGEALIFSLHVGTSRYVRCLPRLHHIITSLPRSAPSTLPIIFLPARRTPLPSVLQSSRTTHHSRPSRSQVVSGAGKA